MSGQPPPPKADMTSEGPPKSSGPPLTSAVPSLPKPIGPGNHEKAWNDPPLFSLSVNTTSKAPARKLTARVGFPISATTVTNKTVGMNAPSGSASLPLTLTADSIGSQPWQYVPDKDKNPWGCPPKETATPPLDNPSVSVGDNSSPSSIKKNTESDSA